MLSRLLIRWSMSRGLIISGEELEKKNLQFRGMHFGEKFVITRTVLMTQTCFREAYKQEVERNLVLIFKGGLLVTITRTTRCKSQANL